MSVILEFTISSQDFPLGRALSGAPGGMYLELERIVPTGHEIMPYVWATGDQHDAFEERVRNHPLVADLLALDRLGDRRLYRVEWDERPTCLIDGLVEADAVILEASGNDQWTFRVRFPDDEKLSQFHDYIIDRDLSVHIERTYSLDDEAVHGGQFDLSDEQREALRLALRRRYFETPSQVTLDELADELGITKQALSDRIRRGNHTVLREAFDATIEDIE